jgi:two-component system sensor histidine kinase CpxA
VRSFFVQIFLSFWIATTLTFIASMVFNPVRDREPPEDLAKSMVSATVAAGNAMVEDYDRGGCAAIRGFPFSFVLADKSGAPLCGRSIMPALQSYVVANISSGQAISRRIQGLWVNAVPVQDNKGDKMIVIHAIPAGKRRWWPSLPSTAIPVSILVTFLFAYLLTRPMRALSLAIRKFTAGDMAVRVPVHRPAWRGIGGADVHTLMDDFNRMADRIQDLMHSQKVLVRDISHELRSPLARLRLALELAREDPANAGLQLDRVEHEADRLNAIIGETLILSLLESSPDLLHTKEFSLTGLFDELLPDIRFEAEARHVQLQFSSAPKEIAVAGYPELMRRALENVLRNAIRYSPSDQLVEIEIRTYSARSAEPGSARMAEIRIADHGPGVPEANLSKIFGPFFRVDASRRESTGGFGVGLAIAERSIHLHGGTIRAENRPEGGLLIRIQLPVLNHLS